MTVEYKNDLCEYEGCSVSYLLEYDTSDMCLLSHECTCADPVDCMFFTAFCILVIRVGKAYRSVVKFLTKSSKTPKEICDCMFIVLKVFVYLLPNKVWNKQLKWGRESVKNDPRSGHSVEASEQEICDKMGLCLWKISTLKFLF
jgi:hypothetical protein